MIIFRRRRRLAQAEHSLNRLALGVQDFAECVEEFCQRQEVSADARLNDKELARWLMLHGEATALAGLCESILHDPKMGLRS